MTPASKDRRQALLGELESIRTLLGEDAHGSDDLELLVKAGKIPLLLPEDNLLPENNISPNDVPAANIPTLQPEQDAGQHIPVLSTVAVEKPDPLDAIRQAAAKVAAARQRERAEPETRATPDTPTAPTPPTSHDREKLVDDIVKAALPRMESLLRELVQEALLQDKLRGGKR